MQATTDVLCCFLSRTERYGEVTSLQPLLDTN